MKNTLSFLILLFLLLPLQAQDHHEIRPILFTGETIHYTLPLNPGFGQELPPVLPGYVRIHRSPQLDDIPQSTVQLKEKAENLSKDAGGEFLETLVLLIFRDIAHISQYHEKYLPVLDNMIHTNHLEVKHARLVKQLMEDYLEWMEDESKK